MKGTKWASHVAGIIKKKHGFGEKTRIKETDWKTWGVWKNNETNLTKTGWA
jgi:hypothetical protein